MSLRNVMGWTLTVVIAATLGMFAGRVFASDSCPPEGTSGCHCATPACGAGEADICLAGWCAYDSMCWGNGDTDGYWHEKEDVETCIAEDPVEEGGCDNGLVPRPCRVKNYCDCDWDFGCENEVQQTMQSYFECYSVG